MAMAVTAVSGTRALITGTPRQMKHSLSHTPLSQRALMQCQQRVRCAPRVIKAEAQQKQPLEQFADNIGLPTDEGIFGFKPFAEVWTGRLAMMGFLTSIVEEYITGKGTLQQIGLLTPNDALLTVFLTLTTLVTLIATANTFIRAERGDMSPKEQLRYRKFLGLTGENKAITGTQSEMKDAYSKGGGDFTAPDSLKAIEQAKKEPKPVDQFLDTKDGNNTGEETSQSNTAVMAKPDSTGAQLRTTVDILEQDQFKSGDGRYARSIEVTNGRWAMLGFWFCIAVEAATGQGIIGQVVGYLKFLNILGAESGF